MRAGRVWLRAFCVPVAVCLSACGAEPSTLFLDLSDSDSVYVVLATTDSRGALVSLSTPIVFDAQGRADPASIDWEVQPEQVPFLLGLSEAWFEKTEILFDPSRIGEVELSVNETVVCGDGDLLDDQRALASVRRRLVESSLEEIDVRQVELDSGATTSIRAQELDFIDELQIRIPVDLEACRDEPIRLEPFTGQTSALPSDTSLDGAELSERIYDVARIDADHVLVLTGTHLVLLERDRPLVDAPERTLSVREVDPDLELRFWNVELDRDPSRGRGGALRAVATLGSDRLDLLGASQIWELLVDENHIELVSTTTIADRADGIALNPEDGRWIASIGGGRALTQRAFGDPMEPIEIVPGGLSIVFGLDRIWLSGDRLRPYVLGGSPLGRVYVGGPDGDRWTPLLFEGQSTQLHAGARFSDGELWFVGTLGALAVFDSFDQPQREGFFTRAPPSFRPCDQKIDECGFGTLSRSAGGLAPDGDWLLILPSDCTAGLALNRKTRCTSTFLLGDVPLAYVENSTNRIDIWDGWLTVVTERGGVFERRLEQP